MNLAHHYIAFSSILQREITRYLRIWPQTLLPPVITMALYFVIFGNLIGPRIGNMAGFNYMDYIAPGLIMMSVITHSYANVTSSFFSLKFQRSIEELLVAPVPHYVILLGFILGGVTRGMLVGMMVTVLSLFFTKLPIANLAITISVVILTSILFATAGFINAIYANKFDDISIIPTFILTPLTYLGGVFYSIHLLPDLWQNISRFNPILYMVNSFRYGFLGVSDIPVMSAFIMIIGFTILLFSYALWLLHIGKGLRQ